MYRFRPAALAALFLCTAGGAMAATLTPAEIVERHTSAVARSDVDALMADYADDAVVLEADKALQGKTAIRGLLAGMFPKLAPGEAPKGAATMTITRKWAEGDVGFYSWQLGPITGIDQFLVRDGKIKVQTVFINRPPPAK